MVKNSKNSTGPGALTTFLPGDRATAPMPLERDGDTAWAEFQAATQHLERHFTQTTPHEKPIHLPGDENAYAPTEHAGLNPQALTAATVGASREPTLDEAMLIARSKNRVCPLPPHWQTLYAMLPNKKVSGRTREPSAPFEGAAWATSGAMPKRVVLREQLKWAERHGALAAVLDFMLALPEDQWHHVGD